MTIRENEQPTSASKSAPTLSQLALDVVRADPKASVSKLVRRWVRQVQADEDLLNDCLAIQGNHAILIALNTLAREATKAKPGREKKAAKVKVKQHLRRKQAVSGQFKTVVAEARQALFNSIAENGKRICDLTGDELTELEANNTARAGLYRELRKLVKGSEIVGKVLDAETFAGVVSQLGDVKDLSKLFA